MLLDTSGLLCLLNPAERAHSQTRELIGTARSLMTHNYVLAELVALAHSRRMRRAPTLQFLSVMAARRLGKVVFVDSALHDDAVQLLMRRLDKEWSLCDAISFLLMERHGETEALTTDHHFEQAGFVRLLLP